MIKKLRWVLMVCLFISLKSCTINGNLQGLYSYYEETSISAPELFVKIGLQDSLCSVSSTEETRVYITNGEDLKKCINEGSALVYLWSPNCNSSVCLPLKQIQTKCDRIGVDLYVVAEYYDAAQMKLDHAITKPIFGIDTEYYGTNLTKKYLSKFMYDLTDSEREPGHRYVFIKDGLYQNSFKSIEGFGENF